MVPEAARRLPRAVGAWIRRAFRNRDESRLVCACDGMDSTAKCTPAHGTARLRPSIRDHPASGTGSDSRLSRSPVPLERLTAPAAQVIADLARDAESNHSRTADETAGRLTTRYLRCVTPGAS